MPLLDCRGLVKDYPGTRAVDGVDFVVEHGEIVGLLGDETTTHVRVKLPLGQERLLPRTQVKGMRSLGQSIMPVGLEAGLTKQQIADLLEFITGQ